MERRNSYYILQIFDEVLSRWSDTGYRGDTLIRLVADIVHGRPYMWIGTDYYRIVRIVTVERWRPEQTLPAGGYWEFERAERNVVSEDILDGNNK